MAVKSFGNPSSSFRSRFGRTGNRVSNPFIGIAATGGITSSFSGYTLHTFYSPGTFTVSSPGNAGFIIVGGGGAGGWDVGGGGGGGGVVVATGLNFNATNYTIQVGSGGAGTGPGGGASNNGQPSFILGPGGFVGFNSVTALGGGGGGNYPTGNGAAGGSGGGGAGYGAATSGGNATQPTANPGISGITQYGYAGGSSGPGPTGYTGGGGGGAGGTGPAGANTGTPTYVPGGPGYTWTINSKTYSTGGKGGGDSWSPVPSAMSANSGDGGDGGGSTATGATGGSGIVIIYY